MTINQASAGVETIFTPTFNSKPIVSSIGVGLSGSQYGETLYALNLAFEKFYNEMFRATFSNNPMSYLSALDALSDFCDNSVRTFWSPTELFNALLRDKMVAYLVSPSECADGAKAVVVVPWFANPSGGSISEELGNNLIEHYLYKTRLRILESKAPKTLLSPQEQSMLLTVLHPTNRIFAIGALAKE